MEDNLKTKMEEDLKKNENGRRYPFFSKTRMTTSNKNGRRPLTKMEDDLKKIKNWKTTSKKLKMEHELKK